MEITFDPAEDSSNQRKHGVSLATATEFEWKDALYWEDLRRDYGEHRIAALGCIGLRLHSIAFVDRLPTPRIVSPHKANSREVKRYAET